MHRQFPAAGRAWSGRLLVDGFDDPVIEAAMLRRITSGAYYALFHAICAEAADIIALPGSDEHHRVYRALDHAPAKRRCEAIMRAAHWPPDIQTCARLFVRLQDARHK